MSKKCDIAKHLHRVWRLSATAILMLTTLLATAAEATEKLDSLYAIYQNATHKQKVATAGLIFDHMRQCGFCDTLPQFDLSTKESAMDIKVHYWMAEYYFDRERYDASLNASKQANALISTVKDKHFKSDLLSTLAHNHFRLGNYDEALRTTLEAYETDRELKDDAHISSDLNSFATIYLAVQQPEAGISYIEKAIAIERRLQRPDKLAARLEIASELYLLNNEPDKAMAAINEAYAIDKKQGRTERAAIRMVQKGAVLEKMSRIDEARKAVMQALPVLENAGITYSIAIAYNQLASLEMKQGNQQQAITYYKKALEQSIKCGSAVTERTAERGLWEAMRETAPGVAMLHLERYTALNDSMQSRMLAAQLKVMSTTTVHMEQVEIDKKNKFLSQLLKWGGLVMFLLLIGAVASLFLAWHRNKSALGMQQQTQDLKLHFFNNITNELQTPLSAVMNAGQQLIEVHKVNADERRLLGNMIVNHGENMLRLVNQLLDIENVKGSTMITDTRQGDIVMFVRMLVDNFDGVAHDHLIDLEFTSPLNSLTVRFSPDHMRKIIHGLVANAFKYTSSNGKIVVGMALHENNRLHISVSDNGKGIPTEERERIFDPFSQSDNGDDGVGTALDLSLAKLLVEDIDGTISVDSQLGQGTTFTIEFPVQPIQDNMSDMPRRLAEGRVIQSHGNKQKPLVFIVVNDESVAYFIASLLRDDYELRFARDGAEALRNAQDLVPNLIITDILMPVMDGKELMRKLRSSTLLNSIPIIAITSDMTEQERLSCIDAGADVVLVKPFSSKELRLQAKHIINQHTTLRERFVKTSNEVIDRPPVAKMSKEDKNFINRLVDVIHAQMSREDIDMELIATAMSLSRKQLRTRVMAITGLNPVAFVLQVRLNYARRMITSESTSLTTIANRCGFQNLSHFSKAFKQQFGVSPLQYRKSIDDISQPTHKT